MTLQHAKRAKVRHSARHIGAAQRQIVAHAAVLRHAERHIGQMRRLHARCDVPMQTFRGGVAPISTIGAQHGGSAVKTPSTVHQSTSVRIAIRAGVAGAAGAGAGSDSLGNADSLASRSGHLVVTICSRCR